MQLFRRWLFLLLILLLPACSTPISEYAQSQPKFDLFQYFDGEVQAWGMLQNYSGKQIRRFDVSIQGTVDGDALTLKEDFIFDDGEQQQRIWKITRGNNGTYVGKADDVVGEAKGVAVGNALNWQYTLRVPMDDTSYDIRFDDWMFRQDDTRVFNVAEMTKWGFTVGKVTLFFEKQ
ncbi:DUF3833 domain-containing protein [Photobacterium lipolyticum]|uniref:DUF3833 domain-containing protein n=1 Tax=Photobacterium lipolyticum TaxID=266810 RepID=A0A2T3N3N6_9GAMM|nr:DUF3833 domain-containing protein [Photobacterium lipolyticum]PSW06952.1 DUF3833 domain-containing protein [Photobacterium lipolyticum]